MRTQRSHNGSGKRLLSRPASPRRKGEKEKGWHIDGENGEVGMRECTE
jgi:hypothetical protein